MSQCSLPLEKYYEIAVSLGLLVAKPSVQNAGCNETRTENPTGSGGGGEAPVG